VPSRSAGVCLQVCVLCGEAAGGDPEGTPAGRRLYEALLAASAGLPDIEVAPVDCFAVCDRPVTLAFQAPGKWSYLVGGADPDHDRADILTAARAVAASPHGIPAMDDRPPFFRKGVIGRLPPAPL
jgi:predicted metal-binding protein